MRKGKFRLFALFLSIVFLAGSSAAASFDFLESRGTAAVIPLSGAITPTASGMSSDTITPEKVRDLNQRALQKDADAIVYEINSGGGAVVASKEVMRAIDSVNVPTVCRFRDIGASGAYLAALGCDTIVADSATLTGSIGVRSSFMEFSGTLDKLGIDYINITSGADKDLGSPYQNVSEGEREMLQQQADRIHEDFLERVKDERNLTENEAAKVSTGRTFLGSEAKELGLVDTLGGRQTAYETAENLTGKDLSFTGVERRQSFNLASLIDLPISGSFLNRDSAFHSALNR